VSLALAIATFLAAIGLTCFCCVRPMRRDRSRDVPGRDAVDATALPPATDHAPGVTWPPPQGISTAIPSMPRQDG
jgi:hypothetical protein